MAGSFELDLRKFNKLTTQRLNNVVSGVVLGLGRSVVENSPVGDPVHWKNPKAAPEGYVGGRFRANWQHGVGSMPKDTFNGTQNVSIQRIQASIPAESIGKIHWLVNNLPYSIALENGHSSNQAPNGIVGVSVLNYPGIVKQAVAGAK